MKIKNKIKCFISLLLLLIFSLIMCKQSTEPTENIKLELNNGFFKIISESPNEIKCSIEFNCQVKGSECKISGYGVKWDENRSGQIEWYIMQTIVPNHSYSISDTFKLSNVLTSDPVVTMQGYFKNSSESDPKLRDQYVLKKK